ncbi:MAG: hypothetical protein LC772_03835 [Chloroflexi bacterium]|nr:hypothetical protein [Chloroflexota bacterium]
MQRKTRVRREAAAVSTGFRAVFKPLVAGVLLLTLAYVLVTMDVNASLRGTDFVSGSLVVVVCAIINVSILAAIVLIPFALFRLIASMMGSGPPRVPDDSSI